MLADIEYNAMVSHRMEENYVNQIEAAARDLIAGSDRTKYIVVTGIIRVIDGKEYIGNLAVSKQDSFYVENPYTGMGFSGTGDLFASVISASLVKGLSIRKAMEKGISGYIPKRADTKVLTGALKLIMDGGTYLPPSILDNGNINGVNMSSVSRSRNGKTLTNRQSQVLELVAQGMSNKQIAYEIGVSEATVKLHINALLRAVGATNRTQAVITAQKMGLI